MIVAPSLPIRNLGPVALEDNGIHIGMVKALYLDYKTPLRTVTWAHLHTRLHPRTSVSVSRLSSIAQIFLTPAMQASALLQGHLRVDKTDPDMPKSQTKKSAPTTSPYPEPIPPRTKMPPAKRGRKPSVARVVQEEAEIEATRYPKAVSSGSPVALAPSSLYITTQPSDHTEFSWALVTTDAEGNATRYAWSNRRPGAECPSPGHLVMAPSGHRTNSPVILPGQVVNIESLPEPSSMTNGRDNIAYFNIDGYFAPFCIDNEGQPCFETICHSVYSYSFITPKMNREAGIDSQTWVLAVLRQLELLGAVVRLGGRHVGNLQEEVLEKSRELEQNYDPDLADWTSQIVQL